jgi:hypothetical protein
MTYIARQGVRTQCITPTIPFVELSIGQAVRMRAQWVVILYVCVGERERKKRIIQGRNRARENIYIYTSNLLF